MLIFILRFIYADFLGLCKASSIMQYATINFHKYKIMFKHAILMFKITHLHSDYFAVSAAFHISVVYTT